MDLELTGKVAIVGGASKGLGRACAQVLADEEQSWRVAPVQREGISPGRHSVAPNRVWPRKL